jgi:hypothetical protein
MLPRRLEHDLRETVRLRVRVRCARYIRFEYTRGSPLRVSDTLRDFAYCPLVRERKRDGDRTRRRTGGAQKRVVCFRIIRRRCLESRGALPLLARDDLRGGLQHDGRLPSSEATVPSSAYREDVGDQRLRLALGDAFERDASRQRVLLADHDQRTVLAQAVIVIAGPHGGGVRRRGGSDRGLVSSRVGGVRPRSASMSLCPLLPSAVWTLMSPWLGGASSLATCLFEARWARDVYLMFARILASRRCTSLDRSGLRALACTDPGNRGVWARESRETHQRMFKDY